LRVGEWERAANDVAAATRPESVRGSSFLSEQPRERLLRMGPASLTDSELLCVLLAPRGSGHPVLTLANALLSAGGGLKALFQRDPHELAALPGLGPARAAQLLAALELGRRVQKATEARPRLRLPKDVYEHLAPALSAQRREAFYVLCLNTRQFLLREVRVCEGSADACVVDPREVFSVAVLARAASIILAHNHHSGDPEPSAQDRALTQQLVDAGGLLNVRVIDHLIVGDGAYFSFVERCQLPLPRTRAGARESWPSVAD
jgi:DNA repair protein RadC